MASEKEKCLRGELYDANHDPELIAERQLCKDQCYAYNQLPPSETRRRTELLKALLGKTGEDFLIEQPFFCDYGYNIEIGEHFYANMNCVILDEAKVRFGDHVFIAPNCGFIRPAILSTSGSGTAGWNMPAPSPSATTYGSGHRSASCPASPSATIASSVPGALSTETFRPVRWP